MVAIPVNVRRCQVVGGDYRSQAFRPFIVSRFLIARDAQGIHFA